MLGCTVILFVMNVLVFYLCDVQIENMRVRFEKEKLEQLNVYQNRQLKLMHQMDEELRIQRHDFQKHISMLAFMNSQGEKEKLTAYLNEMQEGELFQTKFERTDNFVIDSILSYKLQESDRLGIETKMDVKVPKDLNVSAYVLTGILTNLLDNAIEACEKVQDKKIKITIKYAKKIQQTHSFSSHNLSIFTPVESPHQQQTTPLLYVSQNLRQHSRPCDEYF